MQNETAVLVTKPFLF